MELQTAKGRGSSRKVADRGIFVAFRRDRLQPIGNPLRYRLSTVIARYSNNHVKKRMPFANITQCLEQVPHCELV